VPVQKLISKLSQNKEKYLIFALIESILLLLLFIHRLTDVKQILSPLVFPDTANQERILQKNQREVFGFAPYWVFDRRLDNVDFSVLTTFAYFGIDVLDTGYLNKKNDAYRVFNSRRATDIFSKAHRNGTKVVLTLTQMDNATITKFLDNPSAWKRSSTEAAAEVKRRGIDGVNVDFEYVGNPGSSYRRKFSDFVRILTTEMHRNLPDSRVTVSVYASSAKEPKLYDIGALANDSDGIFMMAYDYATTTAEKVMPTSPLYGYKEGKYWYDVSTAIEDFLKEMPAEKLILGVPWYGYNYAVASPEINASVNRGYYTWRRIGRRNIRVFNPQRGTAQTYSALKNKISVTPQEGETLLSGWDDIGQVGWQAYKSRGVWRMIFIEDSRSLGVKYDFAISKNLGGIGIWALGFDQGGEFWQVLAEKYGRKLAENNRVSKKINKNI